jgi:hypothetical protein
MKNLFVILSILLSTSLFASPIETNCQLEDNIDDFIEMPEQFSYLKTRSNTYILKMVGTQLSCEESKIGDIINLLCQNAGEEDEGVYLSIKDGILTFSDYETFAVMATYDCD